MTDIEGIKQRKKYIVEQYQPRFSNPNAISRFSRANEPFVESAQPSARNSVQRDPLSLKDLLGKGLQVLIMINYNYREVISWPKTKCD